ncbi:pseudouridine synthase [Candidatus Bathyarchaeota archaeon]|nr:pseudouridine synthase [Candidatus Bathyarchaeota archaeon]
MTMNDLQKIRAVADYQFGQNTGTKMFPDSVRIVYSQNTGKIRHIFLADQLLATMRPTTGLFVLTIAGAQRLTHEVNPLRLWVKLVDYAEPFVAKGRSAFAKHVIDADENIRPKDEVVILDSENNVLAVGKALLSKTEMKAFTRGTAVRVRRGVTEKS